MKKNETPISHKFQGAEIMIGDVLQYRTAMPAAHQSAHAQSNLTGPYIGKVECFNDPNNTIGVRNNDGILYYVYNGYTRTDILNFVFMHVEEQ